MIESIKRSYKSIPAKLQQVDDCSKTMDYVTMNDSLETSVPLQQIQYENVEEFCQLDQQYVDYNAYSDYYTDLKPMEYIY